MRTAILPRLLLLAVAGCNQLLGLDAPRDLDAADIDDGDADTDDDGDGGGGDALGEDGSIDARPPGTPGTVWALDIDVTSPAGAVHGYETRPVFGPPPEDCVLLATGGGCRTDRCTATAQQFPIPHSGTVTVEGNDGLVDNTPDSNGVYATRSSVAGGIYDPGVTVGVYSTGGGVPAFSAAIIAPQIIRFTAPALPSATSPATFTRSAGIDLTWTPATPGGLFLIIADAAGARTHCNIASDSGAATIPANVLNALSAGAGSFVAYSVANQTTPAGSYSILVTVAQAARRSDGDWARGTITLQ